MMAFPKCDQRLAYETFTNIIQVNPLLKRELKTFLVWGGSSNDANPPSTGNCPYLRLTMIPSTKLRDQSKHVDTENQHADLFVDVLAAMPGSSEGDLIDLWDALVRAIYPKDLAAYNVIAQRLYDVGIMDVNFNKPSIQVQDGTKKGFDGLYLEGKGQILLSFYERLRPEGA